MKKVLIAEPLHPLLRDERSFLDRSDVQVYLAATSDEALEIHRADRVDLIISRSDLPGMDSDLFCRTLRQDAAYGAVPLIMACPDVAGSVKPGSRCKPDVVLPEPVHPVILIAKAREYLRMPSRESIRVTLQAAVDVRAPHGAPFACRAGNISSTGMLIETDRILQEGLALACRFYLPVARLVEAQGKIVRFIERSPGSDSRQYGLLFTSLAPEMRERITAYVRESAAGSG